MREPDVWDSGFRVEASGLTSPNSQAAKLYIPYLEGQGDFVTGLIMGIIGVSIWVIGVITLLTKSP